MCDAQSSLARGATSVGGSLRLEEAAVWRLISSPLGRLSMRHRHSPPGPQHWHATERSAHAYGEWATSAKALACGILGLISVAILP